MAGALGAISSVQVANIAEAIIGEEVKKMRNKEKRNLLLASRDEGDPEINDRLLTGGLFIKSSVVGVPPGMSVIQQTRHVFIRKAGSEFVNRFYDLQNRYELLDTDGIRLFYAGETYEDFEDENGCLGVSAVTFDLTVLGVHGGGVLGVKANKQGIVSVSDFRETLGSIKDASGFRCYASHHTYSVRDPKSIEAFKIRASKRSTRREPEFEIYDADHNKIGYMRKTWEDNDDPEHAPVQDILFGICFPQDMETYEKILLLGALFTIYFQHIHEGGHGSVRNRYCIMTVYILIVLLIIGLLLGLVLFFTFGETLNKDRKSTTTTPAPAPPSLTSTSTSISATKSP